MSLDLQLADPSDDAMLDALDAFAAAQMSEPLRCAPSAAAVLTLYPERWRLPRLANLYRFMVVFDAESIIGYAVVDPDTAQIRWLVMEFARAGEIAHFLGSQALDRWGVVLHGYVENQRISNALLAEDFIVKIDNELSYAP